MADEKILPRDLVENPEPPTQSLAILDDGTNVFATSIEDIGNRIGAVRSVQAGLGISVDNTDPLNPIVTATEGGGDMFEAIYDPQGISNDAFARENHTGVQPISATTGLQDALDVLQSDVDGKTTFVEVEERYGLPDFLDISALLADTTLEYGTDAGQVQEGDILRTRKEGYPYRVLASGASNWHIEIGVGVKLEALPLGDALYDIQFGLPLDGDWNGGGTDVTAQLQKFVSATTSRKKVFTGISKANDSIVFNPVDIVEGFATATGIDFSAATTLSRQHCAIFDNSANLVQTSDLSANVSKGATVLSLTDASDLVPGDYWCIYNPTDWSLVSGPNTAGGRAYYRAGEWGRVQGTTGNDVICMMPTWSSYNAADVDVYRLRGDTGPQVRNIRFKPPHKESCAGLFIDCAIGAVIENVRGDGSVYGNILLQRCINYYANCNLFQDIDDLSGTATDYGLVDSSCMGGKIQGSYYSQRSGITFTTGTGFVCAVPCREAQLYAANTYNSNSTGSLSLSHGACEGITVIGGVHSGLSIGGKNHRFIGCRFRKGQPNTGTSGFAMFGGEIYEGKFEFIGCSFETFAPATSGNGQIQFSMQEAATGPMEFIFVDCEFDVDPADIWAMRVQSINYPFDPRIEITNPRVRNGSGLTQFVRLQNSNTGMTPILNFSLVKVTGVEAGLGNSVPRVMYSSGVTSSRYIFDPQRGSVAAAGNIAANVVTADVDFSWLYPPDYSPSVQAWQGSAGIGGRRFIAFPTSISSSGFTANAGTTTENNFVNTNSGTIAWEAI